jgi:membrane fusion protein
MENRQTSALFREQAVAHAANNLLGKVLVTPKPSSIVISVFLLFWLVLAIYWLCTAQYARQVTVRGWLEPDVGVTNHYATLNNGIVTQILVTPGDKVSAGQPLLKVAAEQLSNEGLVVNALLNDELKTQLATLLQDQQRTEESFTRDISYVQSQIKQLASEKQTIVELQRSLAQQFALANAFKNKIHHLLKKGWASEIDYNNAQEKVLQLESEQSRLDREFIQLTKQSQSLENDLVSLPSKHQETLSLIKQRIADVNQQLIKLNASSEEVVYAKVDGRVSDIYIQPGNIIRSEPLLTVIPNEISLIAMLPVPTHASGFVQEGQSLALRYDAYPHEKFGLYYGEIKGVSDSILLPNQISEAAVSISEPVYMVRAKVSKNTIQAYGRDIALKSGVTFSADIALGERSILEWLFAPLMSIHGRL